MGRQLRIEYEGAIYYVVGGALGLGCKKILENPFVQFRAQFLQAILCGFGWAS
jgi:hypothetical protein